MVLMTIDLHVLWEHLVPFLEKAWIPVIEIAAGFVIGPLVKRMFMHAAKNAPDQGTMTFIGSFSSILIIVIAFIIAFEQLGVRMTSIVALISALGLGISLALKSNMANVAGGIQILLTKPFIIGDYIEISDHKGKVTSIQLMYTTLQTNNNKTVIVPNNELVTSLLTNYTRSPVQRLKLLVPIELPNDIEKVCEEVASIVAADPRIFKDPPMEVRVAKIGEGYASVCVLAAVEWKDYEACRYDLYYSISAKLSVFQKPDKPVK